MDGMVDILLDLVPFLLIVAAAAGIAANILIAVAKVVARIAREMFPPLEQD